MKSKKLFAILTLVAFMMTLVPMAAFGAVSASASYITTDKTSVATSESGIERPIKITMQVRNDDGTAAASTNVNGVYVKSTNDAVKLGLLVGQAQDSATDEVEATERPLSTGKKVYWVTDATTAMGGGMDLKTDANGQVIFYVYSRIGGTANLKFYNLPANNDAKVLMGDTTLTFEASAATIKDLKFLTYPTNTTAGTELTIKAQVYDGNNNGIKGQDVEFFYKKGTAGDYVSIGKVTSNDLGEATLKWTPTVKDASYTFKVVAGSKDEIGSAISVDAASPVKVEAVTASKWIPKGEGAQKIGFFFYDIYNNKVEAPSATFTVTAAPADSAKEDTTITGSWTDSTYGYEVNFTPDVNGEYTIKAAINNTGISTTAKVTAGTFGTVTGLSLKLSANDVVAVQAKNLATGTGREANANKDVLRVKLVDANGLEKDAASSDTVLTTSNASLLSFLGTSNFKTVYAPVNGTTGVATITAIHKATGKTVALDIKVVGAAAAIKETVTAGNDKEVKVNIQMVDSTGANTFYGTDKEYTILAPTGVAVTAKTVIDDKKGYGDFTLASDSYGEKDITVITPDGLSKSFKVTFGAPKVVIGAKNINMYIGAKGFFADSVAVTADVAPFVGEGDRAFVELRNLANNMGVTNENIKYENGVITLTRSDMTLVLTIGSKEIKKTVDGVTTTITADVAPYVITGANRTVLPLRAVGEAFGYTVNYDAVSQLITIVQ